MLRTTMQGCVLSFISNETYKGFDLLFFVILSIAKILKILIKIKIFVLYIYIYIYIYIYSKLNK